MLFSSGQIHKAKGGEKKKGDFVRCYSFLDSFKGKSSDWCTAVKKKKGGLSHFQVSKFYRNGD